VNQDIEQSHAERDLELNRNRQKKPQGGEKCGKKFKAKKETDDGITFVEAPKRKAGTGAFRH
jgi:hypothetical protein